MIIWRMLEASFVEDQLAFMNTALDYFLQSEKRTDMFFKTFLPDLPSHLRTFWTSSGPSSKSSSLKMESNANLLASVETMPDYYNMTGISFPCRPSTVKDNMESFIIGYTALKRHPILIAIDKEHTDAEFFRYYLTFKDIFPSKLPSHDSDFLDFLIISYLEPVINSNVPFKHDDNESIQFNRPVILNQYHTMYRVLTGIFATSKFIQMLFLYDYPLFFKHIRQVVDESMGISTSTVDEIRNGPSILDNDLFDMEGMAIQIINNWITDFTAHYKCVKILYYEGLSTVPLINLCTSLLHASVLYNSHFFAL